MLHVSIESAAPQLLAQAPERLPAPLGKADAELGEEEGLGSLATEDHAPVRHVPADRLRGPGVERYLARTGLALGGLFAHDDVSLKVVSRGGKNDVTYQEESGLVRADPGAELEPVDGGEQRRLRVVGDDALDLLDSSGV